MKLKPVPVFITLLAALTIALMSVPTAVTAETIQLSYANFPPAPTFPCVQMERWKEEVEKRTNGRVRINTFPGSTLLDAKNMMDGVISGQADIGCVATAYQPGRFFVMNAASLPLNIPNARVGSLALWDLTNKYQPDSLNKVKVLTVFTSAPSNIMSKKPVRSLADIQGMDLRASGGAAEILKAWGANQIGMPMSATPEALQKGVVEGLLSSLDVMKDLKFAETCRYVTITDTVVYPFAVVMNVDRWKALPEDVQEVMDELSLEQADWTGKYLDNHVRESIAWSRENYNVEVITLPEEEKAKWDERLVPITEKWVQDAQKKGLPGPSIIRDIQIFAKKYVEQE